jgi:hypothetical protein
MSYVVRGKGSIYLLSTWKLEHLLLELLVAIYEPSAGGLFKMKSLIGGVISNRFN